MSKRGINCPHKIPVSECEEHWPIFQQETTPTQDEDKLRKQIYKVSLTPINDIYFVPPGVDGSVGLSQDKLDKIMQLITSYSQSIKEQAEREALLRLKSQLPDPDDDSKFSPNGAGGWHTPTYQLAVADFISDIDAMLALHSTNNSLEEKI